MKNPHLIPFAVVFLFAATGCDKPSTEVEKKLAELEQKNQQAADRQRELERELEDQKLAAERDAIERERARIEEDRAELERQQGEEAAAEDEALRERERALANREGKLEQFQEALVEKENELDDRYLELNEKDQALAGREAVAFEETADFEPTEAEGDYGMFYDSLDSYGSWFETPDYGYVWQPVAVQDSNWRPYSRGRWACSDRGWTWISEEPFGWATYHYGRWALLRGRGWIWVPGTEWAPSWVSWRENDQFIGWAPLPPETLAYRGHHWDSTVDVQFGISAACFSFVETRHFGNPVYRHCLPVSRNGNCYQETANITFIHIKNRQVICGGPGYKRVSDRVGKPLPFYRLEVDRHSRPGRNPTGMRPQVKGNRLHVSAPHLDAAWNAGLKPGRIKGRLENVAVERNGELSGEIRNRFRLDREDGRQRAEESIGKIGGPEKLDQLRREKSQEKRRPGEIVGRDAEPRAGVKSPERPQREVPSNRLPAQAGRPADREPRPEKLPEQVIRQPEPSRVQSGKNNEPRIAPAEMERPRMESRPERQAVAPRPSPETTQRENGARRQREETQGAERQAEQAREARQEAIKQREEEQARQQREKLREAEAARETQRQVLEQERAQRQQQEETRQRQAQRAQRQQEAAAEQQREMQRQQERAQQREENQRQQEQMRQQQEENQRREERAQQRQQEENQRQQENNRQRQQEENQRQRQAEESRQKQEKDQDEQRRRNR